MAQNARARVLVELDLDQAVVFYEYLSKKGDLDLDEFDAEFEDQSEYLVRSHVFVALQRQLPAILLDNFGPALLHARKQVRDRAN